MKSMQWLVAAMALAMSQVFAQAPVDAEKAAAIKELMVAMNYKEMMSQMTAAMSNSMPQMMDQMMDGILKSDPKATAEKKAEVRKLMQGAQTNAMKEMFAMYNDPQVVQEMEDIMSRAYAKHFTTAEIRDTTAFYSSPTGKKTLVAMPAVMRDMMPEMMNVIGPRVTALMQKMAKDVSEQVKTAARKE